MTRFPFFLLPLGVMLLGLAASHGASDHAEPSGSLQVWLDVGLIALPALYGLGLWRLWRRSGVGGGVAIWRAEAFFAGALVLALALTSLDELADSAFAWHMFQHLLLISVTAPLLVLGSPLYVLAWTLPLRWRRAAARSWNASGWRALLAALWHPLTVWVLATGVFWLWHVPRLYDAAVKDERLHALEHLSFLASSAAFWWVVFQPQGRRALNRGASVVYLFAAALQGSLLGALLTFARAPLYPVYMQSASLTGRDALADQQLAGLVMWVPSGVLYVSLAAVFFVQWLRDEEREQRRRETCGLAGPLGGQP